MHIRAQHINSSCSKSQAHAFSYEDASGNAYKASTNHNVHQSCCCHTRFTSNVPRHACAVSAAAHKDVPFTLLLSQGIYNAMCKAILQANL